MEAQKSLRKIDVYGQHILSSNDLKELILQNKNIDNLNVINNEEIKLFKKYQSELLSTTINFLDHTIKDISIEDFHKTAAKEWVFSDKYQRINVKEWLQNKCVTQTQIDRVNEEYILYEERNLIMLLRFFIYLVDYMRENKFVWGVGRGSSVASYILYLIGVHRVDSIYYQLDIKDYLR